MLYFHDVEGVLSVKLSPALFVMKQIVSRKPLPLPSRTPPLKELDRRRVSKAQSANQNKGLNDDVQNACELLIIEILENLIRLDQA